MIKNDFLQYNALTYEGLLFFFQLREFLYRFSFTNRTNKKRISRPFTKSSNLSKSAHISDNPPHIVSANTTSKVPSSLQKFVKHLLLSLQFLQEIIDLLCRFFESKIRQTHPQLIIDIVWYLLIVQLCYFQWNDCFLKLKRRIFKLIKQKDIWRSQIIS